MPRCLSGNLPVSSSSLSPSSSSIIHPVRLVVLSRLSSRRPVRRPSSREQKQRKFYRLSSSSPSLSSSLSRFPFSVFRFPVSRFPFPVGVSRFRVFACSAPVFVLPHPYPHPYPHPTRTRTRRRVFLPRWPHPGRIAPRSLRETTHAGLLLQCLLSSVSLSLSLSRLWLRSGLQPASTSTTISRLPLTASKASSPRRIYVESYPLPPLFSISSSGTRPSDPRTCTLVHTPHPFHPSIHPLLRPTPTALIVLSCGQAVLAVDLLPSLDFLLPFQIIFLSRWVGLSPT